MIHPYWTRFRRGGLLGPSLLVLVLALDGAIGELPSRPTVRADVPTPIVLSATVVMARTPTPPAPGSPPSASATPGAGSPTPPDTTTTASPTEGAPPLAGTLTAIAGTQTAIAATQTAVAAFPSATAPPNATPSNTASPTATPSPSATAVPCLDAYEDDGVPTSARLIVVGEVQHHLFCPAGDADWLIFFAKEGKGYQVSTSNLGMGVDTYLYLLAPDARTVLAYDDDAPGLHGPSQIVFVPPVDGWYYVLAKNQGDVGFPSAAYTIRLDLVDGPTATATATPPPTPTNAPSATALPTAITPPPPDPPGPPAGSSATPDPLLHPQSGGAGTGGLPAFLAGPADGMTPDLLEPNDTFERAAPVDVGAVYQHLNFVPADTGASADADFYVFRAKPSDCYLVQTGDLSPGLDTTILLWQAAATREGRKLLAQNDDARAHTANLSSAVRWCSPLDTLAVVEVHNYGLAPLTDPRGKTYSLALQIDPPSPTPSPTPRPPPPLAGTNPPAPGGGGSGPPVRPTPLPTLPPMPPPAPTTTSSPPRPTVLPSPSPTQELPSVTPSTTPTATPTPPLVTVDVIAYVGESNAAGPLQGEGIVGWPVQLVDQHTNAVLKTTATDANGHARLTWTWSGPVWIELPLLRRSFPVPDPHDSILATPIYARQESYPLPGIWP